MLILQAWMQPARPPALAPRIHFLTSRFAQAASAGENDQVKADEYARRQIRIHRED